MTTQEPQPVEPAPTVPARVGELVERLLSPPSLGGMGGGSAMEHEAVERWREAIGQDAARLWADAIGWEPEAVRLVELVQYLAGFVPGSALPIRATPEVLERYRAEMGSYFR